MTPNRIAHESRCTSVSLAMVSSDAEVLWSRLMVKADDFGRFDGREAVIRGACFPLKMTYWTEHRITSALAELDVADLVRSYVTDERRCVFFPTWAKYQRSRASTSKFPDPPADAAIRGHPPALADIRGSRDVHVHGVGLDLGVGSSSKGKDALFEAFWSVFPRHAGRRAAIAAFAKAIDRATVAEVMAGAARFADDPNREARFTPHPATWLNGDRWTDDPLPDREPVVADDVAARAERGRRAMHGDDE